jgi:hypothetical protein
MGGRTWAMAEVKSVMKGVSTNYPAKKARKESKSEE